MVKKLTNLNNADWFKELLTPFDPYNENGNLVSCCVPPIYESYGKIFHRIEEDLAIVDRSLTWSESTNVDDFDTNSRQRIRWRDLAERLGLRMHPELNDESFFLGKSWYRYLFAPDAGILDEEDCRELVSTIKSCCNTGPCYFLYDLMTTENYESDLLFEGSLDDIFEVRNIEKVRASPTAWWPEDRRWFVHTDYDLTFTLVGGSEQLIDALVASKVVECIKVNPGHRIDYRADKLNS